MKRTVAVLVVLVLGGCGSKKEEGAKGDEKAGAAATGDGAGPIAALTAYRDEMCACKAPACSHEVQKRFTKWYQTLAMTAKKPSEADQKTMTALADEYGVCMVNALKRPTTP